MTAISRAVFRSIASSATLCVCRIAVRGSAGSGLLGGAVEFPAAAYTVGRKDEMISGFPKMVIPSAREKNNPRNQNGTIGLFYLKLRL